MSFWQTTLALPWFKFQLSPILNWSLIKMMFLCCLSLIPAFDFFATSPFTFESMTTTPSKVSVDIDRTPYTPLYMRLAWQRTPPQHPPLHHFSSSSSLNIVEALKVTNSKKRIKYDLTIIDFNNIDLCDVKHLPPSFDGDILFVLPPMAIWVPSAYGHFMDGITRCATGTLGAQQKLQISKVL